MLLRLFMRGGIAMYPILACSIIALAIILERYWYFFVSTRGRLPEMVDEVLVALEQERPLEAMKAVRKQRGPVPAVLAAAITNANQPREILEDAVARTGRTEIVHMERGLSVLEAIVTMAPLLGLLGTVTGIIRTFNVIGGLQGVTNAADMAPGIAEALFATAFGLMVAVPGVLFHALLSYQVDKRVVSMNNYGTQVVNILANRGERA